MEVLEIGYINFRNLKDDNVKFFPKLNLFYGKNGQGKTSLLESIYFGATGKSFRTAKFSDVIKYNSTKSGVFIRYVDNISQKSLKITVNGGKKEYFFNGKKVPYDEFYGRLNIITYIPEDIVLITGTPSVRRTFFDAEISQANAEYFQDLKIYTKLLKIRNKYLKEGKTGDSEYKIYEEEFVKYASRVIEKRLEYVSKISIILNLNYRKLFDSKKELSLSYFSHLGEIKKLDYTKICEKLKNEIKEKFSLEKRYGFSLCGPQKDDFVFKLNGYEAKISASQGEKKSIIFSLKLSEIDMIVREKKEVPLLIIDDISSYFDGIRKDSILSYLEKRNIQVIISSTGDLDIESQNFYVENGEITYEKDRNK